MEIALIKFKVSCERRLMNNFKKEIQSLVGEKVIFKRIAGNSIILYFHGNPGDANVKSIWIDPIWRYERNNKFIISSCEFPWKKEKKQTEVEFTKKYNSICNKTNSLIHSRVQQIDFDKATNDICIKLGNKQLLRSFAAFVKEEIWIYRNMKEKYSISGYANVIKKRLSVQKIRQKNSK